MIDTLKSMIMAEHSRANAISIANWIGDDSRNMELLMELFLGDNKVVTQRASWPLAFISQQSNGLINAWLPQMIQQAQNPKVHVGVRRNVAKILAEMPLDMEHIDLIATFAFDTLANKKEGVARVYAMYILREICRLEPDLIPELELLISDDLESQTPACRYAAQRVLGELGKMKKGV